MVSLSQRSFDFEKGEILNINKPKGITSFRVVEKVRKWTHCRKVGHAGTLDPMATGVLVLCTGKATKRVSEFIDSDKEYEGTIEFGVATDTDDAEGRQIDTKPVPDFSVVDIDKALEKFRGNIEQIPPMYSALKRNGKRLYKMARKGIVIEREPRPVTIFKLECLDWKRPFLKIRVCCSKGTYIRALARDIGTLLQTGGCLTELCRTRVGIYRIEDSCSLDTFKSFFETAYADI